MHRMKGVLVFRRRGFSVWSERVVGLEAAVRLQVRAKMQRRSPAAPDEKPYRDR